MHGHVTTANIADNKVEWVRQHEDLGSSVYSTETGFHVTEAFSA